MSSNIARLVLGIAAVAAAVVLFVVLQQAEEAGKSPYERTYGDKGANVSKPAENGKAREAEKAKDGGGSSVPTIIVRNGAPVGGVQELTFEAGERVRFRVRSDSADELHVHGYDEERELPAGRTVTVAFPADIEGGFEAELHGSGEQVAELRIEP
jgi:hypothetical protein